MKQHIAKLIQTALAVLLAENTLPDELTKPIQIERTRDQQHGDYATNIAMLLAKPAGLKPRELAELIVKALPSSDNITKTEIAGPGFINFFLSSTASFSIIHDIINNKDCGKINLGQGKKVILEYVSANPTGPLHVGHGRGAAYGATVANILQATGFNVHREYYVNDSGRQMHVLAASIWLRYLEFLGEKLPFPTAGYKGAYVIDIAKELQQQYDLRFQKPIANMFESIPENGAAGMEAEQHMDALITRAKAILGKEDYQLIFDYGSNVILADIRDDLAEFGVSFDEWFPESKIINNGDVERGIDRLRKNGFLYEKDGALWFKATEFNDEKDRVVIRENGQPTYFASDIGYHLNKYERNFDHIVDIFGADHHGYAPRVRAFLTAEGLDVNKFNVLLVQFAILYRGNEKVQMSTRGGKFVTLRELRNEVGNDAARFFYIMRKNDQHLDFDLELAKSQSSDNPVYYIQYAHARICSVFRQLKERHLAFDQEQGLNNLTLLQEPQEQNLLRNLSRYQEVLETSAKKYEPHLIAHFLQDLANDFHTYYNAHQFLVDNESLRNARLCFIIAIKQVLANGLKLLGVSTPEVM